MNVYVFKTSITYDDMRLVNSILRSVIPQWKWGFDLEDCDNILRIESTENIVDLVCFHLQCEGISCEELE